MKRISVQLLFAAALALVSPPGAKVFPFGAPPPAAGGGPPLILSPGKNWAEAEAAQPPVQLKEGGAPPESWLFHNFRRRGAVLRPEVQFQRHVRSEQALAAVSSRLSDWPGRKVRPSAFWRLAVSACGREKALNAALASGEASLCLNASASASMRATISSGEPRNSRRAALTPSGGSAAMARAAASAAASSSSGATIVLTMPAALASSASSGRPIASSEKARHDPSAAARSALSPPPAECRAIGTASRTARRWPRPRDRNAAAWWCRCRPPGRRWRPPAASRCAPARA